jgi:hypothetical protein
MRAAARRAAGGASHGRSDRGPHCRADFQRAFHAGDADVPSPAPWPSTHWSRGATPTLPDAVGLQLRAVNVQRVGFDGGRDVFVAKLLGHVAANPYPSWPLPKRKGFGRLSVRIRWHRKPPWTMSVVNGESVELICPAIALAHHANPIRQACGPAHRHGCGRLATAGSSVFQCDFAADRKPLRQPAFNLA